MTGPQRHVCDARLLSHEARGETSCGASGEGSRLVTGGARRGGATARPGVPSWRPWPGPAATEPWRELDQGQGRRAEKGSLHFTGF